MKTIDTASYFRFESETTEQGDVYFRLTVRDPTKPGYFFTDCTVFKDLYNVDPAQRQKEVLEICWLKAFIHFAKTHGGEIIHTCDDCGSLYMLKAEEHFCENKE